MMVYRWQFSYHAALLLTDRRLTMSVRISNRMMHHSRVGETHRPAHRVTIHVTNHTRFSIARPGKGEKKERKKPSSGPRDHFLGVSKAKLVLSIVIIFLDFITSFKISYLNIGGDPHHLLWTLSCRRPFPRDHLHDPVPSRLQLESDVSRRSHESLHHQGHLPGPQVISCCSFGPTFGVSIVLRKPPAGVRC